MSGQDVLKDVEITPQMIPRVVKGTRAQQLRAMPTAGTTTLYQEVLLRLSVPYDLRYIPAVERAVREAVERGLIEVESIGGRPCLLKLPAPTQAPQCARWLHRTYNGSGKTRSIHYAGSGAQY